MHLFMAIIGFIAGLLFIIKGGDVFVDSALYIAKKAKIPPLIMGATIVSLTTTLPELFVSTMASSSGHSEMAIGNAIGSIICNTGLILGLCALLSPVTLKNRNALPKAVLLLASIGAYALLVWTSKGLERTGAMVLYCLLGLFIYLNLSELKTEQADVEADEEEGQPFKKSSLLSFLLGAVFIIFGARLLVTSGSDLAAIVGVPEKIISLTLIALGTSLPELVTAMTAIRKKENAFSLGNIIGANILNITLVLSSAAMASSSGRLVTEMATGGIFAGRYQLFSLDIPVAFGVCAVMLLMIITKKVSKLSGITLLLIYGAYLSVLGFTLV